MTLSPDDLAAIDAATCGHCGRPATCYGAYEGHEPTCFSCDSCCGHGNEGGWCKPIAELEAAVFGDDAATTRQRGGVMRRQRILGAGVDPDGYARVAIHDGMWIAAGIFNGQLEIQVEDGNGEEPIANVEAGDHLHVARAIATAILRAIGDTDA